MLQKFNDIPILFGIQMFLLQISVGIDCDAGQIIDIGDELQVIFGEKLFQHLQHIKHQKTQPNLEV